MKNTESSYDINTQPVDNTKNLASACLVLIGSICGDIIGSCYENRPTKSLNFRLLTPASRFTDDTVCSIGIADALIHKMPFEECLRKWCRKYPYAGYGRMFRNWFRSDHMKPYNSWGNGGAMRVSAIGAYANSFEEVMTQAKQSAEVTHNHIEGIKGAQATAVAIHYALIGKSKEYIKEEIERIFGYNLSRKYSNIQPQYRFNVSSQGSVPESIIAFLESHDYESAVRMAVAYGGDADTQAAITGGIAAAYYGDIPEYILTTCRTRLTKEIKDFVCQFNEGIGQ